MSFSEETLDFLEAEQKRGSRKMWLCWAKTIVVLVVYIWFLWAFYHFGLLMAPRIKAWHMEGEVRYLWMMFVSVWCLYVLNRKN